MPSSVLNPIWRWFVFAVIALGAGALAISAGRHELAAHWAASSNPATRLRAAENEPLNADLWHQLGRDRLLDFQHPDSSLAVSYLARATSINPHSPFYWMDLATAYESVGSATQAEEAFRKARQAYPASAEAAWRFGNFLLRQNRFPEAFRQIHDAVSIDSKLAPLAVSRCWSSTHNIDQILQQVLPDEPDANWGAINFFIEAREPVAAMALWKRVVRGGTFPISNAFPLIDMLIETRSPDEAQIVWRGALAAAGIAGKTDSRDSLIWNGGFEQQPLNGGFDWRVVPIEGTSISLDEQIIHSGRRSLRVDFDGIANVDFENISQYVSVKPSTRYRFTAFLRTEELNTDSGVQFEVRDVSQPGNGSRFTETLIGNRPWTEEGVEFRTGPETALLRVVVRRARSEKLANKIRGTAWIDDVALVPLAGEPR